MMRKTKKSYKSIIITIAFCFVWIMFNESGLLMWVKLKYEKTNLSYELNNIQFEQKELIQHIDKLENNIDYIEFLAYSKYKMVKPGEKIFRVKSTKKID